MELVYAIRLTAAARDFIEEQHSRMMTFGGKDAADAWRMDILKAIGTLATLPHRCVVAKENALFPNAVVRQFLYQRRRGSAGYRVLFTIHEDTDDAPFVRIQFILHTAQAPMTEWPADEDEDADH
jgi:plasmid stabilization system protein ParE